MPGQTDAFDQGQFPTVNADRNNLGSISLERQGQSWTSQVLADSERPRSVLAPLAFSGEQSPNGTSGQNWQPGLGTLGTGNGMSDEARQQNLDLKFLGGDQDAGLG